MSENRGFSRVPLFRPATVVITEGTDVIELTGRARDISVGGMFVEVESHLAFGMSVSIRIRLPRFPSLVTLPATVRWANREGIGVQFGLLGATETYAITETVRRSSSGGTLRRRVG